MGGKSQHIKYLDSIFPESSLTMVDVFGGAGWVSLKSKHQTKTRVYNDRNPFLAAAFRAFKYDSEKVKQFLELWPKHNAELYKQFQQELFGIEIPELNTLTASKFLYLQTQTFSGNTLGLNSSVYFHKLKSPQTVINKLNNTQIVERIKTITIENKDFSDIINHYDSKDTFFYLDPPYFQLEHYYTNLFESDKHKTLALMLRQLQGRFALSYYFFPLLEEWFPKSKFNYHTYDIVKTSSSSKKKSIGSELVITNY